MAAPSGSRRIYYDPALHPDERTAQLGERVENISARQDTLQREMHDGFSALRETLNILGRDIQVATQPPIALYGLIVTIAIAVAGAFGTLVWWTFDSNLKELKEVVREVRDTRTPITMFHDYVESQQRTYEMARKEYDDKINRVATDVQRLNDTTVSRAELTGRWEVMENRDTEQMKQIQELRSTLVGTYDLKTYLQRVEKELDDLRAQVFRTAGPFPSSRPLPP